MTEARDRSEISIEQMADLVIKVGIDHVKNHPAQDHIFLKDGRVIVFDEGGCDHDRSWTLREES